MPVTPGAHEGPPTDRTEPRGRGRPKRIDGSGSSSQRNEDANLASMARKIRGIAIGYPEDSRKRKFLKRAVSLIATAILLESCTGFNVMDAVVESTGGGGGW